MGNSQQQEAAILFEQALNFFHGIGQEKNLIRAQALLIQSAQMGYLKAIKQLGDWYVTDKLPNKEYDKAVFWYQKGFELGDPQSTDQLAKCYERGIGTAKDIDKAIYLFEKAYQGGNAGSCFSLARIYEKGDYVDMDLELAISWYRKGAAMGDSDCVCNLGYCYFKGLGVKQDADKAVELFLPNAEYNKFVQRNLGIIYYQGTPTCPPDETKAILWLTKAANNGDVTSMLHLGKIYIRKDKEISMDWYAKAANTGNIKALYQYGFYLYKNSNQEEWYKSFDLMKRAAEGGHAAAQFMLGLFYKCAVGTETNHLKAFYWFNLAAENEYEQAFSHIGRYYKDGRLVPKNYETALFWFEKAIPSKDNNVRSEALYDYGCMYLDGLGVKKDKNKAIGYFKQSKDLDCINAINKLKELGNPNTNNIKNCVSDIIDHGDIIEFVKMKILDGDANKNWPTDIVNRLIVYVESAIECGIAKQNEDGHRQWLLNEVDYALWVIAVSEDLKLSVKTDSGQTRYYPKRFAKLFLNKKGKEFANLRHHMSELNKDVDGPTFDKKYEKIEKSIELAKNKINN